MGDHTPGPWVVDEKFGGCIRGGPLVEYARGSGQEQIVMVVSRSNAPPDIDLMAERNANARLIAAAPELLEALGAALRLIEQTSDYFDRKNFPVVAQIEAAIAKAEGRSNG